MLALTSCDIINGIRDKIMPPEECTEHTDIDGDGKCDDCSENISAPADPEAPDLSGITFEDVTVTYNGDEHSIYVDGVLPDGVSTEYIGNGKTNAGEYEVTVKFFFGGEEIEGAALKATLTIEKATADTSDIMLSRDNGGYNREPHIPALTGTVPDGVTVAYTYLNEAGATVDEIVSVGTYKIIVSFVCNDPNYNEISDKEFTYTVSKGTYDMSGVRLLSTTKVYDGIEVIPSLSGTLPEGVSASFTYKNALGETVEKMIDAGVYTVYATFSSDNANYYPIDPISATVTIEELVVDFDGIRFDSVTVPYDGGSHTITVAGELPAGVRVVYEGGDKTAVGAYEITARFYIGELELEDERRTATLTIIKGTVDMSGVGAVDASATYNGSAHTPILSGVIPAGVDVVYTYTDSMGNTVDEIVAVGTYMVTATFVYDSACYNDIAPMSFTYTVTKASLDADGLYPDSLTKTYDGVAVRPTLAGTVPAGVEIVYTYTDAEGNTVDEITAIGEYTVVASFVYDESIYEELAPITFVYTVTKGTYDLSGVTLESFTKTYDGEAAAITLGTLPAGLTATLTYKDSLGQTVTEMVNAGTYTVIASFAGDFENYYPVSDITVTVVIERAAITGISFTDTVFNYDGEEKSIFAQGAPEWMQITYVGNGVSAPGTYTVVATFSENANYLPIPPMQAKIIIEIDKSNSTDGILFEEYGDGYAVSGITEGVGIVVIPETYNGKPVLSVKSFAFAGESDLWYVYIPSSVVNIGNKAFADCTSLTTVEFGDIKVIGQEAFKNTAIKEISLPESLESIGFGAFEGTALEKITLPFVGGSRHTSNAHIGFIFGGSTYAANAAKVPTSLKTVVLSNGCTKVPPRAFYGLTSLEEVVIGRSVKELGNGAFQGCSSLRNIYIPASVTAIPANAKAENSPFYGTAFDMMVVLESDAIPGAWGQYFAHVGEGKSAIVIYGKTYDDYVMNKDSYRVVDPTDATLGTLFVGGYPVAGFDPSVYEYTVNVDVNAGLPEISAMASVSSTTLTIEQPSVSNGNVATVTVTSMNGENTLVYKVRFNVTGSFETSSEIVNKDGAQGTVTFVVDDGYKPSALFMKSMMEKYPALAVTYAIATKNFLGTTDEYTTVDGLRVADIDGDGLLEYVLDENGKYIYVRNEENIAFWRDILSVGRSEIVAHSHTHAFWGVNDEGGAQLTAGTSGALATRIYSTLVKGSVAKEIYASMQIVNDIFGDSFRSLTYVNGGIPPKGTDTVVKKVVVEGVEQDPKVYLSKQTVRVLYDTEITVGDDGKVYLKDLTWVDLQSTVGTLPANTDVKTTADVTGGMLPAGTPIYLASDYITIPTTTKEGEVNIVKGFQSYLYEMYEQALEDGTFIGARTSGQRVYVPSDFLEIDNRIHRSAYIITTSTDGPMPTGWKTHIDNAISKSGWASFCIHAMTETSDDDSQGVHNITWAQAEELFAYAASKGSSLWIATQTDATLYYHEWSTATVTSSYDADANKISVTLTDEENDELYTMPLTVKLTIPGTWASVSAGGRDLTIREDASGTRYVYVDVAPETTVEVIGR